MPTSIPTIVTTFKGTEPENEKNQVWYKNSILYIIIGVSVTLIIIGLCYRHLMNKNKLLQEKIAELASMSPDPGSASDASKVNINNKLASDNVIRVDINQANMDSMEGIPDTNKDENNIDDDNGSNISHESYEKSKNDDDDDVDDDLYVKNNNIENNGYNTKNVSKTEGDV